MGSSCESGMSHCPIEPDFETYLVASPIAIAVVMKPYIGIKSDKSQDRHLFFFLLSSC